jgi:hypothetical protein
VGSYDGYLHAVNSDGTLRWRYETMNQVHSSPAIGEDGTVYVGSDNNHLYAINPDGTLKWRYETEHFVWSSPAIGGDGTMYFGSHDGHLYAIGEGDAPPTPAPTTGSGCTALIPSDGRAQIEFGLVLLALVGPGVSLLHRWGSSFRSRV